MMPLTPYYQDTWVTLYHGDCREVLPYVSQVDLVLTDPPYGIGLKYGTTYTDKEEGYQEWLSPIFADLQRRAKLVMLTPGIPNMWRYPQPTWVLCWYKPASMSRNGSGGANNWEPILVYGKHKMPNDVIVSPIVHQYDTGSHPCPKPLKLFTCLVEQGSLPGHTILDPFAGSGTTMVAAKALRRNAIGIEIEAAYCDIAVKRLQQDPLPFTGPVLSPQQEALWPR